jgi:hypothetical protein
MEDYDPSRLMDPLAMYNPTGSRTAAAPHALLQPAPVQVAGAPGIPGPGGDLEPIPLSKATVQRLHHPPGMPITSVHYAAAARASAAQAQQAHESAARRNHSSLEMYASMGSSNARHARNNASNGSTSNDNVVTTEKWLEDLRLTVSGLSIEPLSGTEVLTRLRFKTEEVVTRYLPCVDFLVACQQDLRKGLAAATQKRMVHHMFRDAMTPRQFLSSYITLLPERFFRKNRRIMQADNLDKAVQELQKLVSDARAVEHQGCEVIKNTFLGGMKDGESWGLRKWLSRNGGALHICNDCECILTACQKLDRGVDSTRLISERMRPLAEQALAKLKKDVPSSYQEISTAHPYLPFFHRLESALKGVSNFDPEDDDVICIDDEDEVEELKQKAAPPSKSKKRKAEEEVKQSKKSAPAKKSATAKENLQSFPNSDNSDEDSMIEVLEMKPSKRKKNRAAGGNEGDAEYMNALAFFSSFEETLASGGDPFGDDASSVIARSPSLLKLSSFELAISIDRLVSIFDSNQQATIRPTSVDQGVFWGDSPRYAMALRLFSEILRMPEAIAYLDPVDEPGLTSEGYPKYTQIIKHPLCFRDIFSALLEERYDGEETPTASDGEGLLSNQDLNSWNMWRGLDLLQAMDLVFLNSLAYGKASDEGRSSQRSKTNKLRKHLWAGIKSILDDGLLDADVRRKLTPTRRGESSGFVVRKDRL